MSDDLHDKTNAELDLLAAEWMGWRWRDFWCGSDRVIGWYDKHDQRMHTGAWSPTTRWDHAGEMYTAYPGRMALYDNGDGTHTAVAYGAHDSSCEDGRAIADTPTRAVCLATLMAARGTR